MLFDMQLWHTIHSRVIDIVEEMLYSALRQVFIEQSAAQSILNKQNESHPPTTDPLVDYWPGNPPTRRGSAGLRHLDLLYAPPNPYEGIDVHCSSQI